MILISKRNIAGGRQLFFGANNPTQTTNLK